METFVTLSCKLSKNEIKENKESLEEMLEKPYSEISMDDFIVGWPSVDEDEVTFGISPKNLGYLDDMCLFDMFLSLSGLETGFESASESIYCVSKDEVKEVVESLRSKGLVISERMDNFLLTGDTGDDDAIP